MTEHNKFTGPCSWLAILGAAFFWSWCDHFMYGPAILESNLSIPFLTSGKIILPIMMIVSGCTYLVLYFIARITHRSKTWKPQSFIIASITGFAASLLIAIDQLLFQQGFCQILGIILLSLAIAYLTCEWGTLAISQGMEKALLHFACAWSFGLILNTILMFFPPTVYLIAASLLPLCSCIFYLLQHSKQDDTSQQICFTRSSVQDTSDDTKEIFATKLPFAFSILVLCTAYGWILFTNPGNNSVFNLLPAGYDALFVRGVFSLLIVSFVIKFSLDEMGRIFQFGLSFISVGIIALVISYFSPSIHSVARILVAMGYLTFDILIWVMISYFSRLKIIDPRASIAGAFLIKRIGMIVGMLLYVVITKLQVSELTVILLFLGISYLVIIVVMIFTRQYLGMWPTFDSGAINLDTADMLLDLDKTYDAIYDQYNLSTRESEVFRLLSEGRSAPYIADALVISENTVKSHIRHIYKKCKVNNRQDFIDLVESFLKSQLNG